MKTALRYLFLGALILLGTIIFGYFQSQRPVNIEIQENDPVFNPKIPIVEPVECENCKG